MTKQEADFIGSMNMCDEISNEAYKKIMCNCEVEEQQPCEDCVSREAIKEKKVYSEERHEYVVPVAEIDWLPSVQPQSLEQIKWERDTAIEQLEQLGYGLGEKVEPCKNWYDVPSDEMTLEQARQAVKDLRKKLAEYLWQEPCEDFISRKMAIEAIKEIQPIDTEYDSILYDKVDVMYILHSLPSVKPQIEPCTDCVRRKELLSRIDAERRHLLDIGMDGAEHIIVHHARRIIEDMPAVKPQRPKGEWVEEKGEYGVWSCSECKELFILTEGTPMDNEYHYCPNCGSYNGGKTNGNE